MSAAVNGTSLVATFSRGLKTTSLPSGSAFTVTADGSARTVTGVAASGSSVTLTLGSTVGYGATVLLSYTDPTAADDTTALQGASDDVDVASFGPSSVTNNTPNSLVQEYTASTTVTIPSGMRYVVAEAIGPGGGNNGNGGGGGGAYVRSGVLDTVTLGISDVQLTIPQAGAGNHGALQTQVWGANYGGLAAAYGGGSGNSAGVAGGDAASSSAAGAGAVKYSGGSGAGGGGNAAGGGGAAGPSGPGAPGLTPSGAGGAGGGFPAGAGGSSGAPGASYGGGSGNGIGLTGAGGWVRLTWTP